MKQRKGIVGQLDKVTAKIVKIRDDYTCQRCLNKPHPQGCHWAHIYGRRDYRLRWDLFNAICLCYGCHQWGHSNPTAFAEWFEDKWKARAAWLRTVRRWPHKTIRTKELEALLEKRKQKLKELSTEARTGGSYKQEAVEADAHY